MKKILLTVLLSACGGVFASGVVHPEKVADPFAAQSGIFVTAETGWTGKASLPTKSDVGASSLNKQDLPVFRMAVGYLHYFNDWFGFGVEAARGYFGKYTYKFANMSNATVRNTTMDFMTLFVFHHQQWNYFFKLGGIRNTTDIQFVSGDTDKTKIQPEAAIGLDYFLTPHIAITGQFAHSFGQKISSLSKPGWKAPSLNELLVGLKYTFF